MEISTISSGFDFPITCQELGRRNTGRMESNKDVSEYMMDDTKRGKSEVTIDDDEEGTLIYKVNDVPPFHLTVLFALQQSLLSIAGSLATSLLVADAVCASNDETFKARLLSSTLFMNGFTTAMMCLVGIRLPLFQGAAALYIMPLLAMASVNTESCSGGSPDNSTNATDLVVSHEDVVFEHVRNLQGPLVLAGLLHSLVGVTGMVSILLRFVGPVTIVPTMLLIGIYISRATLRFSEYHWGLSLSTAALSIILSQYLSNRKMPIPFWTYGKGFRIIRYPLHQVFAILIAMMAGWSISGILTVTGALTDDKDNPEYFARTDSRSYVISTAPWFNFPYPGQYGAFGFSVTAFVGFIIASIMSIMDSIGDYYACARVCRVPPPPAHGVNRGIAIEGLCSALSGAVGCGHATSTYGGNIGAIGITRVASRSVFLLVGVIYMVFGVLGKVAGVFIAIPYPVLGGAMIVYFGMFIGVILSNLQSVSLTATRNLAIMGTSVLVGLMMPMWVEKHPDVIQTGSKSADSSLKMMIGSPNFIGSILACFLDNTIPGSLKERGIAAWIEVLEDAKGDVAGSDTDYPGGGMEVYAPLLPKRILRMHILRYIPFFPNPKTHDAAYSKRNSHYVA
ncbi:hypothetical protein ScPMuIL_000752 [Solemya velum]